MNNKNELHYTDRLVTYYRDTKVKRKISRSPPHGDTLSHVRRSEWNYILVRTGFLQSHLLQTTSLYLMFWYVLSKGTVSFLILKIKLLFFVHLCITDGEKYPYFTSKSFQGIKLLPSEYSPFRPEIWGQTDNVTDKKKVMVEIIDHVSMNCLQRLVYTRDTMSSTLKFIDFTYVNFYEIYVNNFLLLLLFEIKLVN